MLHPGGEAVEAFSNPLWTGIVTLGAALRLDGGDGIPLLKSLGLLLGAVALVLTALTARRAYPDDDPAFGWVSPAILAVWTPFVFWSGAGLENPLYVSLLLLAVLLQLREVDDPEARPWSALALGGVALTRPEGCAFFIAFFVHRILASRGRARLLSWTAIFVAICATYLTARVLVFGDWLPNTYYAKISDRGIGDLGRYLTSRADPGFAYIDAFARTHLLLIAAAALGFADWRGWRANLLLVAVGGGTALYAVYVGGDFWPAFRFLSPALPMLAIGAQHGMARLPLRNIIARQMAAVLLVGFVAVQSVGQSLELRERDRNDKLISLQGRLEQGRKIQALARDLGLNDPLYLDPDIGGPSVVGLRVLDLAGLSDVHVARFQWYPPFLRAYVFNERRPHIIRTHSYWTRTSRLTEFPEFHEQYVAIESRRDEHGLHGEFIRKDLLPGNPRTEDPAKAQPSFRQAIASARERRIQEDAREREGWIRYYTDRGKLEELLATFREHRAAGSLTTDPAALAELYYGLLGAGDRASAESVRAGARIPSPTPVVLADSGTPVLSLIAYRLLRPEMDWPRLQLYFEVLKRPETDYELAVPLPSYTARYKPRRGTASWHPGTTTMIDMPMYADAGTYEIRAELVHPDGRTKLCPNRQTGTCQLLLGTHRLGRW